MSVAASSPRLSPRPAASLSPSPATTPTPKPPPPRPALCTGGRGTRGVAAASPTSPAPASTTVLYTATSIAHGPNTLHAATYDAARHAVAEHVPQPCAAPVYALTALQADAASSSHYLAVGLRRGVSLWRREANDPNSEVRVCTRDPTDDPASTRLDHTVRSLQIDPDAQPSLLLAVCTPDAAALTLREGDVAPAVLATVSARVPDEPVVAGGWVSRSVAFLATRAGEMRLLDVRAPGETTRAPGARRRARPRAAAVLRDGAAACVGGEDGSVWQIDLRGGRDDAADNVEGGVVWATRDAHRHWVTALCERDGSATTGKTVWASGGTDGVVRCWDSDGRCQRTLPLHDDTVTGVRLMGAAVVSASYDGRVAVNVLGSGSQ